MRTVFRVSLGFVLISGFGAVGCGGDDDDGGGSGSDTTACKSLCDKQEAGGCSLLSAADCKQFCDAVYQSVNADCRQKLTASSECQAAAADPCNSSMECQAEIDAANQCTGSG